MPWYVVVDQFKEELEALLKKYNAKFTWEECTEDATIWVDGYDMDLQALMTGEYRNYLFDENKQFMGWKEI